MTFSSIQQQPAEVLHLKRESDEKSVHLQVLQILHILCFTDVNSETEIHFFLVKFMNSTSENMNQKQLCSSSRKVCSDWLEAFRE